MDVSRVGLSPASAAVMVRGEDASSILGVLAIVLGTHLTGLCAQWKTDPPFSRRLAFQRCGAWPQQSAGWYISWHWYDLGSGSQARQVR